MYPVIFENAVVSIQHHPLHNLLLLRWPIHLTGDDYSFLLSKMIQLSAEHNIEGWFVDATDMEELDPADLQWTLEQMPKLLMSTNVTKIARLVSQSLMYEAKLNLLFSNAIADQNLPIRVRFFTDEDDAMEWLISVNKNNRP